MNRYSAWFIRRARQSGTRLLSHLPNPAAESQQRVIARILDYGFPAFLEFNEKKFCNNIESFTDSMCIEFPQFRYANSVGKPTLYSSVYACLIYSMTGKLKRFSQHERDHWIDFFDQHQDPGTGLWFDQNTNTANFAETDWWGARHLVLHLIPAYTALGGNPKYRLSFLNQYYDLDALKNWLDGINWNRRISSSDDTDNKIMNVICAMQYERDEYGDDRALHAVNFAHEYLSGKCSRSTGLWGKGRIHNRKQLSRLLQYAYHILSSFYFDGTEVPSERLRLSHAIVSQNKFGGFGLGENSSACEDIDSIDILCRHRTDYEYGTKIELALRKAMLWILSNQNDDGGFVFRLNEPLRYGHDNLSSAANESALFPTWFRALSIAIITKTAGHDSRFVLHRVPGYYSH